MRYVASGYWADGYDVGDITPISATIQSSASANAELSLFADLSGTVSALSDALGTLSLDADLSGIASSSSTAGATLSLYVDLSGTASAMSEASGTLTRCTSLSGEAHTLTPSAQVDLYCVDLNAIGVGQVFYFYAGTSKNSTPVTYQGATYTPWYINVSGIDKRGTGSSARPTAEIGNAAYFISDLCRAYQDMVGAIVRRRRTLSNYILADIGEYQDEYYLIERRAEESAELVKFELASPLDFLDKQLPGLLAIANSCPHRYKSTLGGSGCSWPGTNPAKWFDRFGTPVSSAEQDVCGKRLSDCKLRFGATSPLDYGGNPGLGRNSQ
jgi:lambda family phage minor tail protein L